MVFVAVVTDVSSPLIQYTVIFANGVTTQKLLFSLSRNIQMEGNYLKASEKTIVN